jgi:dTDP-glucose 4,6-dehydratase
MKKTLFITGAEGFIGSHLTEKLINLGYNVNALILYNFSGDIGNLKYIDKKNKKLNVIFGDIADTATYISYLKRSQIVINLASLISVPYSFKAPLSNFQNNILGTSNFFLACKNLKIEKFIHFSSSEIYGTPKKIPITEKTHINPQSPYAASKASIDQIAKSFYFSYGLPIVILRPFNNYGPRQSRRAIIPEIICQLLKKNTIKLGDISTKRDFLYVNDTVSAVLKIMNSKNVLGQEINIGSHNFYKIEDIIKIVAEILSKKVFVKLDKSRLRPKKSEVKYLLCDYSKAKRLINWSPSIKNKTQFKKSLFTTIEFYKKNLDALDKIYHNE